MESLHLRSSLTLLPSQIRRQRSIQNQASLVRATKCFRSTRSFPIGTVLVRARRGGTGGEEDEERDVPRRAPPWWQRAWGLGARKLGLGETWKADPRGQRELDDLDSFLEGKGLEFRWRDVLDPTVENVLALVLTGLFVYAILLIGWQLVLVTAAITLSALKYAVIAAALLGVLIFFI